MVPHLATPEENRVDRYVWGLSPEIRGEFGNPKTLQDTVNLATRLTNNANRSGIFASDKVQCKKKMEEPMKRQFCGRTGKNQKVIGNFGIRHKHWKKEREHTLNLISAITIIVDDASFASNSIREAILLRIVGVEEDEHVVSAEA